MKKLLKTICGTCDAALDVSALQPLIPFKCPGCGNQLHAPAALGHLRFDKPLGKIGCFSSYEGFDAKNNIYATFLLGDFKDCGKCDTSLLSEKVDSEIAILNSLSHPNICPVSGKWNIDGVLVVESPRMDGFDFSEYMPSEHGFLNAEMIFDILQKVAVGVATAHHNEVIHHDISPANIHMDARGNVRIKNFFVSRFLYKNCSLNDWCNDITPYQYMSPEKIETREEGGPGDIFSFGVLSYFLLTGQHPFRGVNREEEIFARVPRKNEIERSYCPIPPNDIRDQIPKKISDIIIKMLSYNPVKRPQLADFISSVNLHKAEVEKDNIYDAQWNMVLTDTDTKLIPRMSRLGPKDRIFQKEDLETRPLLSLKSLFEKKKGENKK